MVKSETIAPEVRPPDPPGTQPDYLYPPYASSISRAPAQPLVYLPHTISERTGPVFGHGLLRPTDNELTAQHADQPLGERILVHGRVLDENGRPVRGALVEVWQANAAGRYRHKVDQHDAPLDPNFSGAGRHRRCGILSIPQHQTGCLSVGKPLQRLASGAHPLFTVWSGNPVAASDTDVFSWRSSTGSVSDLQQHHRPSRTRSHDRRIRHRQDRTDVRAGVPLRYSLAWCSRHSV